MMQRDGRFVCKRNLNAFQIRVIFCLVLLVGFIGFVSAEPIVEFSANVTFGTAPLTVSFTDLSLNNPTGWAWYFGDENFTAPWTQQTASAGWLARYDHSSVAMPDGSIVLMGGNDGYNLKNDVWRSTDNGATWTEVNASAGWSARTWFTSVAMPDGSIVLMGGYDGSYKNDVWRSTDNGATWTQQTASAGWSEKWAHSSVAMPDGSIVLMGGISGGSFMNDVWRSTDNGATWTRVNASAGWTARYFHSSVAMPDGSIVLMGGNDGGDKNDVWRSTDNGATWTRVNASAGWSVRYQHSSVAMPDGSIVLMGGRNTGNIYTNDVWRSTDSGTTWTQVTAGAGWSARYAHSSVAMPDGSIVLMGGWRNDVWRFMSAGSSAQNPSHTYTTPGTYKVALQVYNAGGYNSMRKTGYITVTAPIMAVPTVTGIAPATGINTTTVSIMNLAGTNFTSGATVMLTPVNVNPVHKGNLVNGAGGALLSDPRGVYVSGNYAYVASSGSNALEIIDVSNPVTPVHKSSIVNGAGGALLSVPNSVYVSGNYAYVTSSGSNALEIVDVSNPAAPVHAGSLINGTGGALLNSPNTIDVSGNYAYVTSSGSNALEIVDVSNPAAPVHAGSLTHGSGGALLNSPNTIDVSGNYAYVTSSGSNALENVDLGTVTATGITVVSANQIIGNFDLTNKIAGSYTVVVTNPGGAFGTLPGGFTVTGSGPAPVANFAANITSGTAPLAVQFYDNSTGTPISWNWSFGDGTWFNTTVRGNPAHTYTMEGAFTVTLYVAGAGGSSSTTKDHYVTVTEASPLTLAGSTFFGGSGDQIGTGIATNDGAIYVTGDTPLYSWPSSTAMVLKYMTDLSSPVWSRTFGSGTYFYSVAAANDGVFAAGANYGLTHDHIGGKEAKTFLAKFGSDGTDGPGPEGSLWATGGPGDLGTFVPSYDGGEVFYPVTTAAEGGSTAIYTVGSVEPYGWRFIYGIAKYDLSGNFIGVAIEPDTSNSSSAAGVTTLNGYVYSVGWAGPAGGMPILWKYDKDLNQIWRRKDTSLNGWFNAVTASGNAIYAAGTANTDPVTGSGGDYLIRKYDEAGNLLWSKTSGGSDTDILTGVVGIGSRLFAAGYTKSEGAGGADAVVLEIDPETGNTLSTTLFGGAQDDMANGVSTDGTDLFVVGASKSFASAAGNTVGQNDLMLLRYTLPAAVPVVIFTAIPPSGNAPLTVQFNDTSSGSPTAWNWSFGDGTFSTEQNPVHTYAFSGTFSVSLNGTNAGGSNVSVHTNYIVVNVPKPFADFSANVTSGTPPLQVSFTDLSLNSPTGWVWYFGDENFTEPWTQMTAGAQWTARYGHTSVVMPDSSIVLMGGEDGRSKNDVWRSTDNGVTWALMNASAGWTVRYCHTSVVMPDGSIVLMGGQDEDSGSYIYLNDVWRSTDNGATWTQMTASAGWTPRVCHSSVAMPDGSILLIGGWGSSGSLNDVWRSMDNGATWALMNASAGWSVRCGQTSVVMPDGNIILMGGGDGTHMKNDVWRSMDYGASWAQLTPNAGWTEREIHSSVVMPDGSIMLMGGWDGTHKKNDVWRSTNNGASWTQVTLNAGWTIRRSHTGLALTDGSIVLMGGDADWGYTNDVWRFMPVGSSAQNPSHTYTTPGTYPVALEAYNAGGYNSTRKTGYITVTGLPMAQFSLGRNAVYLTEGDMITRGNYMGEIRYDLILFNEGDASHTTLGNLTYELDADNITIPDWSDYAVWNATHAVWRFPSQYVVVENASFRTGISSNYTEGVSVNANMSRVCNQTLFNSTGYQLVIATVEFSSVNASGGYWWRFIANPGGAVNPTFVPGSLVTDIPLRSVQTDQHHLNLDVDTNALQPGFIYTTSCLVRVEPTGALPVVYKPKIVIGQVLSQNTISGGVGYSVEMPAYLLPDHIHSASVSTNVSNTWTLNRQNQTFSVLQEVSEQQGLPMAQFTANMTSGIAPLAVQFYDNSTGSPTAWNWSFGDGHFSILQNPAYTYPIAGNYSVSLNVSGAGGFDKKVKNNLITVNPGGQQADHSIILQPGWNFVSTPRTLESGNNTAMIFKDVGTESHTIWLYDASGRRWTPMTASTKVRPLDGIWIFSTSRTEVPLHFTRDPIQTPPTRQLFQGWNAIGFSDTIPASARATLLSVRNAWTQLIGYDAANQQYEVSIINGESGIHSDSRSMVPTKGYWLYITRDGELASISS